MNAAKQLEFLPALSEFNARENETSREHSLESGDGSEDVRVKIIGEFDAVRAFKRVFDMLPPIGHSNRVTLDFAEASSFSLTELSHFLLEAAWHPRFRHIEFSFDGLPSS